MSVEWKIMLNWQAIDCLTMVWTIVEIDFCLLAVDISIYTKNSRWSSKRKCTFTSSIWHKGIENTAVKRRWNGWGEGGWGGGDGVAEQMFKILFEMLHLRLSSDMFIVEIGDLIRSVVFRRDTQKVLNASCFWKSKNLELLIRCLRQRLVLLYIQRFNLFQIVSILKIDNCRWCNCLMYECSCSYKSTENFIQYHLIVEGVQLLIQGL